MFETNDKAVNVEIQSNGINKLGDICSRLENLNVTLKSIFKDKTEKSKSDQIANLDKNEKSSSLNNIIEIKNQKENNVPVTILKTDEFSQTSKNFLEITTKLSFKDTNKKTVILDANKEALKKLYTRK